MPSEALGWSQVGSRPLIPQGPFSALSTASQHPSPSPGAAARRCSKATSSVPREQACGLSARLMMSRAQKADRALKGAPLTPFRMQNTSVHPKASPRGPGLLPELCAGCGGTQGRTRRPRTRRSQEDKEMLVRVPHWEPGAASGPSLGVSTPPTVLLALTLSLPWLSKTPELKETALIPFSCIILQTEISF